MEIENSETNDSILEKSDEMEFDSKISELLNEASLIKPIDITKTIDNQDSQITKDIGNIENKLFPQFRSFANVFEFHRQISDLLTVVFLLQFYLG
jgi:hypothetical protein